MTIIDINTDARDGAMMSPTTSGSNRNPHEPCSIGNAIDLAGIDGLGLPGASSTPRLSKTSRRQAIAHRPQLPPLPALDREINCPCDAAADPVNVGPH